MTVHSFTFNPFQTNCYVCHDAGEAVIVDPACAEPAEQEAVVRYIEDNNLTVRHLLLTHAHIDHIFGCAFLAEKFGLGWQMHRSDLLLLEHAADQGAMFGVPVEPVPAPAHFLSEGDEVTFGNTTFRVLHTPGHSPGSICYYDAVSRSVLAGDVLFQDSIGRTDLWMGSLPELMRSIFSKLVPLGDDVTVYPGHGPATTIGMEIRTNPFLQGRG